MNNPSNYYSCNSNRGAVMTAALGNANVNQPRVNSNDHFQPQQPHHPQQQQQQQQQQHQQLHLLQPPHHLHMPHMQHLQHPQQHQQVLQHPQHLQQHLQHQINMQQHMQQPQQQQQQQNRYAYMECDMQTYSSNAYAAPSTPAPYHHQQHNRLASIDGIQSGVPTLTTSTLTPTTLRNIEQTFIELTADPPNPVPYQAGFVPPAPFNYLENNETNSMPSSEDSQNSWDDPIIHEENSMATTDTSSVATTINANDSPSFQSNGTGGGGSNTATTSTHDFTSVNRAIAAARAGASGNLNTSATGTTTQTPSRRNQGGRRPTKATNMSPEEEEKRRIRRERNKLAAARCRKRRVDQTNELLGEVADLEKRRDGLQKEITALCEVKEELQAVIEEHRPHCRNIGTNNNNLMVDTYNRNGRVSPLDLKPVIMTDFDEKIIKSEPNDNLDSLDGPPSPKRVMLSQTSSAMVPPLPNVSTISTSIPSASVLNTPTITNSPPPMLKPGGPAKQRPSSLNVPLQMTSAQAMGMGKPVTDINGVAITTPSSGVMFNFDSLMDGGTGLTPVSGPLIPTCSSQNKHPLELTTPTSEPSKLKNVSRW